MIIPTIADGICFAVPHTALSGVERIEKSKPFDADAPACAESAADEAVIFAAIPFIVSSRDAFMPSGSFLISDRFPTQSPTLFIADSRLSNLATRLAAKSFTSTTIFTPTLSVLSAPQISRATAEFPRSLFSAVFSAL